MRILLWYMDEFDFHPAIKNLESADEGRDGHITKAIVAFIHGEEKDEEASSKVETKLVKNIKWLSGKLACKNIVLHSFAHLGTSKCDPQFLKALFDRTEERLKSVGYAVQQTPYGHFLDIKMVAPGKSLARVYKEF